MTSEHDALLAAILADPAADLPRMVYADFVEERMGEVERAEFIRVQIKHDNLPPIENDRHQMPPFSVVQHRLALETRSRELLRINWVSWHREMLNVNPIFRRGFVEELSAPLRVLIGGECPSAIEWNRDCSTPGVECFYCYGTGRVPGILPRLVWEQPIETVRVTDREPMYGAGVWTWFDGDNLRADDAHGLPDWVYRELKGYTGYHRCGWKSYPTRQAAEKALSDALLKWAKQQQPAETLTC